MRKTMIVIAAAIMFASCGSGTSSAPATDSTVTNTDSVQVADSSVTATDTTVAQLGKQ